MVYFILFYFILFSLCLNFKTKKNKKKDFTLKGHNFDRPRHYIVQGIQKALYHTHSDNEFHQAIPLSQDQFQKSFPVNQGTTLELCIGQYWSSLGQSEISFEVSFHGLLPSEKNIVIHGSSPISRVDVQVIFSFPEFFFKKIFIYLFIYLFKGHNSS